MEISGLLHYQPQWQGASHCVKVRGQMITTSVTEAKTPVLPLQWNVTAAVLLSFVMLVCRGAFWFRGVVPYVSIS